MDRICPLLALEADLRTVIDGFDPDHRCTAAIPALALDRATQQGLCLHEGHLECARYREWTARARDPGLPRPALDATFARTRLVMEPEGAWRGVTLPARGGLRRPGRAAVGGVAAVLVVGSLAAAGASTNGFGLLAAAVAPSSPVSALTPTPTRTATPGPTPTTSPSATPTPAPTPTPRGTAVPARPTPRPTPQTYVVAANDTLSSIAARFGVSVQAIVSANQLADPNTLRIGQVLIIP